jgi:hypothetical protein
MLADSAIAFSGMLGWNDGGALSDRVRTRGLGRVQRVRGRSSCLRAGFDTRQSRQCDRSHASCISRCPSTGGTPSRSPSRQGLTRDRRSCSAKSGSRDGRGVGRAPDKRAQGGKLSSERSPWRTSTEACSEVGGGSRFQSNFSPRAAKHQGKAGETRDQRARRINNLANPAKSAKPPSPVQIRAAPPNSQCEFDLLCIASTSERF